MGNSYSLNLNLAAILKELNDAATMPTAEDAADRTLTYDFNLAELRTGSTANAVSKAAVLKHTCNGSDQTVDLTAIGHSLGRSVDGSSLAPTFLIIEGAADNDNPVTVKAASSNGFPILGAASLVLVVPGGFIMASNQGAQAVDSTHKNVTINGTSGDIVTITVCFGAIPA